MRCLFCGDCERVEILEVYTDGEFQLDTCCEGMRDQAAEYLAEDPKAAAAWIQTLGHDGDETPILPALHDSGVRRVIDHEGQLLLDWNLQVVQTEWAPARDFVGRHHRHNKAPRGWRYGAAVRNGSQQIAVTTVGRPVARAFDKTKVVEVNRVCVRTDVPKAIVWNACSLLYGWAAREAKKRGFERIITYTRADEDGTSLKAAGWKVDGQVRARRKGWRDGKPTVAKTRWVRELRAPAKNITCVLSQS